MTTINKKVSELTAASALTGAELFYAEDGTADVKVTADQIKAFAEADSVGTDLIIDEDDMASDSDERIPTQQSVKAYVDAETTARAAADVVLTTAVATEEAARLAADALKAPLASPALTGTPTAPTAAYNTDSTQLATMAAMYAWTHRTSTIKTNIDYTFALGDEQTIIRMNSTTARTLTVPPNSSVAFPVGTLLLAYQFSTGTVTIAAGVGVTLESDTSILTLRRSKLVCLWLRAANTWVVFGVDTESLKADKTEVPRFVATRVALAALTDTTRPVYLTEAGREGVFLWSSANNSSNVTEDTAQGIYVPPTSDTDGSSGAWVRVLDQIGVVSPCWFGVTFDGSTDDKAAWNKLIASINANLVKTVLCPAKSSLISATLDVLTASEWTITAVEGGIAKIFLTAGTSGTFFKLGDASNSCGKYRIIGLRLVCLNTPTSGNAIDVRNAGDGIIDMLTTDSVYGHVTIGSTSLGTDVSRQKITRCKFEADATLGGWGLDVQSWAGLQVSQTNFSATGAAHADFRGMKVHPASTDLADTTKFSQCEFNFGTPNPIYNIEYDASQNSMATQIFEGCVFDQAVNGANFYVHIDSGAHAAASTLINCIGCTSNASTGSNCILLDNTGAKPLTFKWVGGTLSASGGTKALVEVIGGAAVDVLIADSNLCSRSASITPDACIKLATGVSGVAVVGNKITQLNDVTLGTPFVQPNYLVYFAGNAANCLIANNGCANAQIGVAYTAGGFGSANASSLIIRNNLAAQEIPGAVIQTADASTTNIAQKTLSDETVNHVEATVIGVKSDGSARATYKLAATFYRTGAGSATLQGAVTVLHSVESDATWAATMDASGNNVRVRVTGVAATTINWSCRLEVLSLKTTP